MKVYVAARFHERERVKKIYEQLHEAGHEVTQDWTVCTTKKPYSEHPECARNCAEHAIEGVKECEVFIFLTNPEVGAGSSAELGAALLSNTLLGFPRIYAVGPYVQNNICLYHPVIELRNSVEDVLQEL